MAGGLSQQVDQLSASLRVTNQMGSEIIGKFKTSRLSVFWWWNHWFGAAATWSCWDQSMEIASRPTTVFHSCACPTTEVLEGQPSIVGLSHTQPTLLHDVALTNRFTGVAVAWSSSGHSTSCGSFWATTHKQTMTKCLYQQTDYRNKNRTTTTATKNYDSCSSNEQPQ